MPPAPPQPSLPPPQAMGLPPLPCATGTMPPAATVPASLKARGSVPLPGPGPMPRAGTGPVIPTGKNHVLGVSLSSESDVARPSLTKPFPGEAQPQPSSPVVPLTQLPRQEPTKSQSGPPAQQLPGQFAGSLESGVGSKTALPLWRTRPNPTGPPGKRPFSGDNVGRASGVGRRLSQDKPVLKRSLSGTVASAPAVPPAIDRGKKPEAAHVGRISTRFRQRRLESMDPVHGSNGRLLTGKCSSVQRPMHVVHSPLLS